MLSSTHLSKIAVNSSFCLSVGKPRFDGQSIFSTVATHTARNSRATGFGPERLLGGAAAQLATTRVETNAKTKQRNIVVSHHMRESPRIDDARRNLQLSIRALNSYKK